MAKISSPFTHTVKLVRKASVILTGVVFGWLLLFSSATVYGYHTKELQKITIDPIKTKLEKRQNQTKQATEDKVNSEAREGALGHKTKDEQQQRKAAEYVRRKQQEIKSRSKEKVNIPAQTIQPKTYQLQKTQIYTPPNKTNGNTTLDSFRAQSQAETDKFRQESQAQMDAFKTQSNSSMESFDEQAKSDMETFKAESTAKTEAFKTEHGIE